MNRMHMLQSNNGLFVTNPTNIRYLTGFVGLPAQAGVDERDAYCLLTQHELFLFTNALYLESTRNLKSQIPSIKQNIVEISRENPISKKLANVFTGKRLGFEEVDLTVAELRKLKETLTGVELVPTQNRIEELRMIKRKDEIENIRLAAKLTDQCFTFILNKLKPGVTENQITWEIESFFRKNDAEIAFSPIAAFGKNSSQPHYQNLASQGGPLRNLDIVLLDFGARVNGYCADMTRVVFLGKPKAEWLKTYQTVHDAQRLVLESIEKHFNNIYYHSERARMPLSGAELDRIARNVIENTGLPVYPHSLGHAVGLDIHEAPRLTIKKSEVLKSGMVVTVEPGVYIEGSYGIRIEDLVLLKEKSIEILSRSPKGVTIL